MDDYFCENDFLMTVLQNKLWNEEYYYYAIM